MTGPTVCCVMLTRDRPEMARRAIECFRKQTYKKKRLLVADNSTDPHLLDGVFQGFPIGEGWSCNVEGSIGEMRNQANQVAKAADIIAHWDDDDYGHPNRIAEQVALLQSSGADCVGYREMLFWREPRRETGKAVMTRDDVVISEGPVSGWFPGEAWLYAHHSSNYALGTSLMYWRRVWDAKKFNPNLKTGEDKDFIQGLNCVGVCSTSESVKGFTAMENFEPRMIASIHGANTASYDLEKMQAQGSREWKRVPTWDARVGEIMEAA